MKQPSEIFAYSALGRATKIAVLLMLVAVLFMHTTPLRSQTIKLQRSYQPGETIAYKMHGINQSPERTIRYEVNVTGVVTKESASGNFIEDLRWSDLQVNGEAFPLSPASREFREPLSLSPKYKLSVPDLSKVQPILIGPITDLLTFYADVQLAMRQTGLNRPGDHLYIKHGVPNSWADGTYTLIGQDSIDFDLTLVSIDPATQVATLIVRHVPPALPQIKLPAPWMLSPGGSSHSNWVQVQKRSDGKYAAAVGEESFEADIKLSLPTGQIIAATLDNPVDVRERDCTDVALTKCAAPIQYRIRRQITLVAEPNGNCKVIQFRKSSGIVKSHSQPKHAPQKHVISTGAKRSRETPVFAFIRIYPCNPW
jgi:hypothetical protein